MNFLKEYYEYHAGIAVTDYVDRYIRSSHVEMYRINASIDFLPMDIESVLDVGAGYGILLEQLKLKKGINGVGVEIVDAKINYGISIGCDMRKGYSSKLDFPDKSFDAIISTEVIEHLPYEEYENTISEFERVSQKYIVISVPLNEKRIFLKCPYCGSSSNPNNHLRSFNENDMIKLFPNAKLICTKKIGETYRIPLKRFVNYFSTNSWHQFFICPVCGYKKNNSNETKRDASKFPSGRVLRQIMSFFVQKKPQWILALYDLRYLMGNT